MTVRSMRAADLKQGHIVMTRDREEATIRISGPARGHAQAGQWALYYFTKSATNLEFVDPEARIELA